jgi:non-ribosomal peptide synthetase component E (peptide arylation enzyme)
MFLFQEKCMKLYSHLVDLRETVTNATGKKLAPVEEIVVVDFDSMSVEQPIPAEMENELDKDMDMVRALI